MYSLEVVMLFYIPEWIRMTGLKRPLISSASKVVSGKH